jgi:hypothetical protein
MLLTLPAEFISAKEEVAQMCLGPKEAMFKKHEESSQHLKSLYIQGHIDGKPISRMLIDSDTVVNLMSYSVFKKLGRVDDRLMKTNLMLNGVAGGRGQPDGGQRCRLHGAHRWEQVARYRILHHQGTR